MNLKNVDDHTTSSRKLLVTDMALEVFGLLMLHQYLLVVKFSVAIVAPYLRGNPLLLLPHNQNTESCAPLFKSWKERSCSQGSGALEKREEESNEQRSRRFRVLFVAFPYPERGFSFVCLPTRLTPPHVDLWFYSLAAVLDFSFFLFLFKIFPFLFSSQCVIV